MILHQIVNLQQQIQPNTAKLNRQEGMSNKLKTASSLSADSTQVRYQKALKQISKLINFNTELKEESNKHQQAASELKQQVQILIEENNQLMADKSAIKKQLDNCEQEKAILAKENEELRKQLIKLRGQNYVIVGQNRPHKKQSMQSCPQLQRLSEDHRTIVQLQKILNNKDETIRQLNKKVKNIENTISQQGLRHNSEELSKFSFNNYELVKKLSDANQYIYKMNGENANLKAKLFKAEGTQRLLSVKSLQAFDRYTPQVSPRSNFLEIQPRNSEEVLKRYHHLESENKKLSKKNQALKADQKILTDENAQLKKDNTKYANQVSGYEALIEKQQKIIQDLHQQYDKVISGMTEQFKKKLIQQRESFSPAKSAKQLDAIDLLQQQNRQLKKRLQLFQIQLQKCLKIIDTYKTKLSECERDVDELMKQREQLIQKLTKLQSSHRQKSNYSRGSASRILGVGNGSGGVDGDRRNSMGETGHFNYP